MNALPDHLTREEVIQVLEIVEELGAVVVGGQSLALWARYYAPRVSEIADVYSMSSEDIDFYARRGVPQAFAAKLQDAQIYIPGIDENTPNAAVVVGKLGDRTIRVDFLHSVKAVERKSLDNNYVEISGSNAGKSVRILLMHPLDCVRSRLSNINDLRRADPHSISSAQASIYVLQGFIEEMIAVDFREAQRCLLDFCQVIKQRCLGTPAHKVHGIEPSWLVAKYLSDERFDTRWRQHQLFAAADRLAKARDDVIAKMQEGLD